MLVLGIFLCLFGGAGLLIRNANKPLPLLEYESEEEVEKKKQAYQIWEKRRDRASQLLFAGIALIIISIFLLFLFSML